MCRPESSGGDELKLIRDFMKSTEGLATVIMLIMNLRESFLNKVLVKKQNLKIKSYSSDEYKELVKRVVLNPGLANDVALECLTRIPFHALPASCHVSRRWTAVMEHPQFHLRRRSTGLTQPVVVLSQAWRDPTQKPTAQPFYRLVLCDAASGEWTDLPLIPELPHGLPVLCHLVGVGSELVVLGGCDPVSWRVLDAVFIYNFVTGTWRRGAHMPGGQRLFFGCASDSDRTVYVAGGHDEDKKAVRSALAYDVAEDKWTRMPDMAVPRDECIGVYGFGRFHVIGGYATETQGRFERHAETFDIATWRWGPVNEDFLRGETEFQSNCICCYDGEMYTCQKGKVMIHEGDTWRVMIGLPGDICHVDYVTAWQGKLLVIGYCKFEEPHRAYVLDLNSYMWTRIEAPEDYLGHVQSGCFLEI